MARRKNSFNPLSLLFVVGILAYGLFTIHKHGRSRETAQNPPGTQTPDGQTIDPNVDDDFTVPGVDIPGNEPLNEPLDGGAPLDAPRDGVPGVDSRNGVGSRNDATRGNSSRGNSNRTDPRRTETGRAPQHDQRFDQVNQDSAARRRVPNSGASAADSPTLPVSSDRDDSNKQIVAGRVAAVVDGDTLDLMVDAKRVRIRLEGIDAPERGQRYQRESSDYLKRLCDQQVVYAILINKDRYGRTVADIYRDDVWINGEMVKAGFAWHYKKYNQGAELAELERQAQLAGVGLWADRAPVAPWEYRNSPQSLAPVARQPR